MDQLFLQRVSYVSFVDSKSTNCTEEKNMRIPYISSTNLNKSNLFPVLLLFLDKGDIYLLKYPFSYQVPGQYLITNINKSICNILLENTNKSAIDLQLKAIQ